MKKVSTIIILGVLVISGISSVVADEEHNVNVGYINIQEKLDIKTPPTQMVVENGNLRVFFDEEIYLVEQGKPILPKILKTFELPFGIKNFEITVKTNGIEEKIIDEKIRCASQMLPLNYQENVFNSIYEMNFEDDIVYPDECFNYKLGCGINKNLEHITHLSINIFPVRYYKNENRLEVAKNIEVSYRYDAPLNNPFPEESIYDMVIIAPSKFSDELQRLIAHKNEHKMNTTLKTTEDIYKEYEGRDKPEQIKYFIRDAIETWNIKYVLIVGGLKSKIFAVPRDDVNQGTKGWNVPVRYTNLYDKPKYPLASSIHDPGSISDLYYADIYREGGVFEDWDPNGDNVFSAWGKPGVENDTGIDFLPDVSLGRLACVSTYEVKTLVDKIINYEKQPCDPSWFKKMVVVSGDGFLDQQDLNIQWDTNDLLDGEYVIHAQSRNEEDQLGPIDLIEITINRSVNTRLTFNHDDHLKTELQNGYPAPPIVEIVTVSNGDILGNTNYTRTPGEGEAYNNDFNPWANMSYVDGVLTIRGKSYDPQGYGAITHVHLWITNDNDDIVFEAYRNNTEMYFEGEWTTGNKTLLGRGGALYYMPDDFEKIPLWTSNGLFTGESDVVSAIDEGCGFLFFSGHGSSAVWGDQKPGIPGNRQHSWVTGLHVSNMGLTFPFINKYPVFPMNELKNAEKLPIAVIGGCHNSQFNVSLIPAMIDAMPYIIKDFPTYKLWTYGTGVPETFSWHIVSRPNGGAIASMGNTGFGYGMPHKECTTGGGDGWITIEFFRQYGEQNNDILGNAYSETLKSYIGNFDMTDLEAGHAKTVQQWVLLGDPSLKIGGYE